MIISASRRTDLPAFYAEWFINRIRAGYCLVVNPFNRRQVRRVSLLPQDVDALVFWTKSPGNLVSHLPELDRRGFRYYFLYTLNHYPAALEPGLPPLEERLELFGKFGRSLDPARVIWRYDPIIISNRTTYEFHVRNFSELAERLAGGTRRVIVSTVEYYRKTARRLAALEPEGFVFDRQASNDPRMEELMGRLAAEARSRDMELFTCASKKEFSPQGAPAGRCIDPGLIKALWDIDVAPGKDPGQRPECGCARSVDIGANDTCGHGCPYCYAVRSDQTALANRRAHDPHSPCLDPQGVAGDY